MEANQDYTTLYKKKLFGGNGIRNDEILKGSALTIQTIGLFWGRQESAIIRKREQSL